MGNSLQNCFSVWLNAKLIFMIINHKNQDATPCLTNKHFVSHIVARYFNPLSLLADISKLDQNYFHSYWKMFLASMGLPPLHTFTLFLTTPWYCISKIKKKNQYSFWIQLLSKVWDRYWHWSMYTLYVIFVIVHWQKKKPTKYMYKKIYFYWIVYKVSVLTKIYLVESFCEF